MKVMEFYVRILGYLWRLAKLLTKTRGFYMFLIGRYSDGPYYGRKRWVHQIEKIKNLINAV